MKKTYMKPETRIVPLKSRASLLSGSKVGDTPVKMKWNDTADDGEYGL